MFNALQPRAEAFGMSWRADIGRPGRGYGYQWWTVPASRAYEALALQGQYIHVDPETRTVVVKLSYFPPGRSPAAEEPAAFFAAGARWPEQ